MPCAWTPVSVRVPAARGDRGAEERVDLLRRLAADRRGHGLGVAGGERDLGAHPALAVADALGDPGGEVLGLQRLAEDGLVDRLVDDLLEAGHVGAGLLRVEIDVALELGEVELRAVAPSAPPSGLIADDLLDAAHADAGQADLGARAARLHVGAGGRRVVFAEQCGRTVHRIALREGYRGEFVWPRAVAYSLRRPREGKASRRRAWRGEVRGVWPRSCK